jgi:hypothetical protein
MLRSGRSSQSGGSHALAGVMVVRCLVGWLALRSGGGFLDGVRSKSEERFPARLVVVR